jgi:flagellar basal-body rod modification protein FlgD
MPVTNAATSIGSTKTTSASDSKSRLAGNFDQFLTLLTTQLKNQSPLEPLDTNKFTEQLVQFASVEQQLKTNESLTALLALNKATAVNNAIGFVGTTVIADGRTSQFKDGKAQWLVDAPRGGGATITIKDSKGSEVAAVQTSLASGSQSFAWDGKTSTGARAPDGNYTITVTAKDNTGGAMAVKTDLRGVVDGVDLEGDQPVLKIGTIAIPIDKVKQVVRTN